MSVTPSGMFSLPLDNARTLLANAAAFQTLVEKGNATDAKTRIFIIETDEEFKQTEDREFCPNRAIIGYQSGGFGAELVGSTGWNVGGPIEVRIEAEVPDDYRNNYQWALWWFLNSLGAIVTDMRDLIAPNRGYLNITDIKIAEAGRLDPDFYNGAFLFGGDLVLTWRGFEG